MKKYSLLIVLPLLLITIGCAPLERSAYNTVVAAKAFLDVQRSNHKECATGSSSPLCSFIAHGVAAKDTLIDAAEVYCSSPAFESGGECEPPKKGTPARDQAEAKLKAAIAGYKQAEKDIKGAF